MLLEIYQELWVRNVLGANNKYAHNPYMLKYLNTIVNESRYVHQRC
jgi:hypothetical protein